jgi:hypothetical protein
VGGEQWAASSQRRRCPETARWSACLAAQTAHCSQPTDHCPLIKRGRRPSQSSASSQMVSPLRKRGQVRPASIFPQRRSLQGLLRNRIANPLPAFTRLGFWRQRTIMFTKLKRIVAGSFHLKTTGAYKQCQKLVIFRKPRIPTQ